MLRRALAFVLLATSTGAQASWSVATSNNFIVYSEGGESSARDAAARLERFQTALRFISGATSPPSPIRIKVFLVDDPAAVWATMPFGGSGVAGYYETTVRGPYTVMSRTDIRGLKGSRGEVRVADSKAQHILFHELTHHFTRQYFPAAYPVWYSEGFAEYIGSMEIAPDNVVTVGNPVNDRYASFLGNQWLPVREMLNARSYADVREGVFLLYAQGWLLVHYLSNTKERPGQLRAYLTKINAGTPFDKAATEAFGDLDKLNGELRAYAKRGKLQALALPFKKLDAGPVEVRALTAAEEAMLPFEMRLYSGVPAEDAASFADRVTAVARRFPADASALRLTYEAQQLAERSSAAAETVEKWLSVAPDDGLAIAAKADLLTDRLAAGKVTDPAQWKAARALYVEAVRKAPNTPSILRGFYRSYVKQGVTPPDSAQNALYSALELIPQQDDLRREVAADFEARGMIDAAIAVIRPAAFEAIDPSELSESERRRREANRRKYKLAGAEDHETAREMLKRLEQKRSAAAR
jgi:hypothetical protein